jgi:hypothetical protein
MYFLSGWLAYEAITHPGPKWYMQFNVFTLAGWWQQRLLLVPHLWSASLVCVNFSTEPPSKEEEEVGDLLHLSVTPFSDQILLFAKLVFLLRGVKVCELWVARGPTKRSPWSVSWLQKELGCVAEFKAGLIRVQEKLVGWFWICLKPIGNLRVLPAWWS